jgi:hypothetical protein
MAALELSTANAFHFSISEVQFLKERARMLTFFEMRYYLELAAALSESFAVGRAGVPETHSNAKPRKCSMNKNTHQDGWRRGVRIDIRGGRSN